MQSKRPPSQRQLKVSEEVRHVLSSIFLQDKIYDPSLYGKSITVSEVRVSPDLRKATAFVYPLGGEVTEGFIKSLNKLSPQLSHQVARNTTLKYSPSIFFKLDEVYDNADKIETLISQAKLNDKNSSEESEE